MIPDSWIPHRRGDGELVGYVRTEGESFVPVDLFGHDLADAGDWHAAESTLEETGLAWLADAWLLHRDEGDPERVLIVEVTPQHVLVKGDDMNRPRRRSDAAPRGARARADRHAHEGPGRLGPRVGASRRPDLTRPWPRPVACSDSTGRPFDARSRRSGRLTIDRDRTLERSTGMRGAFRRAGSRRSRA